MKRLTITLIVFFVIVSAGCEMVVVDDRRVAEDMYNGRLVYVYDYGEAVPAEAGVYRSSQAVLEGIIEVQNAWTDGVEKTMAQVDVTKAGKELGKILCRLYQQGLYED